MEFVAPAREALALAAEHVEQAWRRTRLERKAHLRRVDNHTDRHIARFLYSDSTVYLRERRVSIAHD